MSTSDLYILNGKSTRWVAEFRNGWGSGPCIWDHLASKYLPNVNFTDFDRKDYVGWERKCQMTWDLAGEERVTAEERIALMMTFDLSYAPIDHLKAIGNACIKAHAMIEDHGFWSGVNHWRAIGEALIEVAENTHHRHSRGVVLNCTSVNDVWMQPSPNYLEKAWPIYEESKGLQ
jgi:hypothetical protein